MAARASQYSFFAGHCLAPFYALALAIAIAFSPRGSAAQTQLSTQSARPTASAPAFTDEDALSVLDNVQAALQSYNRKKFLAQFDSARMPHFSAFQTEIKGLFDRYDSFTVTYHLVESAVQSANGVVLADFGLDGTASSETGVDLRRHTQLRLVVAWNGREWKIVELSPRTIFQ